MIRTRLISNFERLQESIQPVVMRRRKAEVFWTENWGDGDWPKLFIGFVQAFFNHDATTPERTFQVAYTLCAVLMNASPSYRRFLVENGHTSFGLFLGSMERRKDNGSAWEVRRNSTKLRLTRTHEIDQEEKTIQAVQPTKGKWKLETFLRSDNTNSSVEWILEYRFWTRCKARWKVEALSSCHLVFLWHFAKKEYVLLAQALTVKRHCVRSRWIREGDQKRKERRNLTGDAELMLRTVLLSPLKSFLEKSMLKDGARDYDIYSLITFNPLHNWHLWTPGRMKECLVLYRSLDSKVTNVSERRAKQSLC